MTNSLRSLLVALRVTLFVLLTAVAPLHLARAADVIWVDDAPPAGATLAGSGETWTWVSTNPAPFSGSLAHQSAIASGTHYHMFSSVPVAGRLTVNAGEQLIAYVYLDPANPPTEIMLMWYDGSWNHRAFWGADKIGGGLPNTAGRRYIGPLPPVGQWVRLEVPASFVDLSGRTLSGMAFVVYDGRATWDRSGKGSAPANALPIVHMSAPGLDATYQAPVDIGLMAMASDSDGTIAAVEFYDGATLVARVTSAPYVYTWSNVPVGSHSLRARAIDNLGGFVDSNAVTITVIPGANTAPTVSLTAPATGASYTAPASISLTANASDSDGSISQVAFYNGASLIGNGILTGGSYTYTWSNVAAGSYSLTAKATDNAGAVTTSAAVNISVTSPPPPPPSVSLYYLYADHLNTPRVATDSTNKVVWRWDSDAFGTSTANEDPDGDGILFTYNPRFPGQYFDKETNLHYNYFRDYEPGTGRYVQSDPIGLAGGMNTYGYVGGNPLSHVDQLGLFCGSGWNDPFVPDTFPGGVSFSSPCKKHDICYEKCGASKYTCDQNFLSDMLKECSKHPSNSITLNQCMSTATFYWKTVLSKGQGAFNNAQKSCQQCKE